MTLTFSVSESHQIADAAKALSDVGRSLAQLFSAVGRWFAEQTGPWGRIRPQMGLGARRTVIATLALCSAAAVAVSVALAGCGGEAKPTTDEVNAGYLQVAKHAIAYTFTIQRATEDPPDRPGQIAREFRGFASNVDHTATFLLTVSDLGPVGAKAFVFGHSLGIYESTLLAVARRARRGDLPPTRLFRGVRQAGAEVRGTGAAWERTLRAAIAD